MNRKLMPGDKVIWYRTSKNGVLAKKVEAEVFYKPSPQRVAIRFRDKAGDLITRFVPPENVEKVCS